MQTDVNTIWSKALEILKQKINQELFNLWFSQIHPCSIDGDTVVVEVANDFYELWIKENYESIILDALKVVTGKSLTIRFKVTEYTIGAPDSQNRHKRSNGTSKNKSSEESLDTNFFNPNNTFDTFVVGNGNQMAHSAAVVVAQTPGKVYNPLFIYGGCGLGKTHLLHAIGNYLLEHKKNLKVAYVSCERFTNEFIESLQEAKVTSFRKKYRNIDVLLIDDIHFLAGKERIQEEFFHTFNALFERHKQIVLTSDRPANEIKNLENRLVSRFIWGLSADLQPPDIETRIAILKKKGKLMGYIPSEEVLEYLANHIKSNIRKLEGALVRLKTYQVLTNKEINIDIASNLLHDLMEEDVKLTITIEIIQKKVAEYFDLRVSDLTSRKRPANIALPRQIAMYLARKLTNQSLNEIGEAFVRDHGTVIHACKHIQDLIEVDPRVREQVNAIERSILK